MSGRRPKVDPPARMDAISHASEQGNDMAGYTVIDVETTGLSPEHHDRIVTLHLKDRDREGQGRPGVLPFGEGTTPVRDVMQLLKTNHWPIPAMIEYEYKGGDTVAEVKKSYAYLKQTLA